MLKPQQNALRQTHSLDGFWSFRRDPADWGETAGWHTGFAPECELAVPGSWNEQRTDLEGFFGRGWYQTVFHAPEAWGDCDLLLHVGSAQNHARIWLNGVFVGEHRGGCLPFACALSPHVRRGSTNLLVMEVDGSMNAWDLPAARIDATATHEGFHNSNPAITYDFFPFCGIARSVTLELTPTAARLTAVRIDAAVHLVDGTAAVTVEVQADSAEDCAVEIQIEGQRANANRAAPGLYKAKLLLSSIRLWDVGQPELYTASVSLVRGARAVDAYIQTFGLRHIEVTANELRLNGRPIFLNGFGKHEDFAVVGRGLIPALVVRDFDLLRWTGANSFRTSHYPYAEEWYDYADRQGILVVGETPLVGLCQRLFESADVLDRALDVVSEMIARDRHHPSVIMWSVANEPTIKSRQGESFISNLLRHARTLDPLRPITYVAHMEPEHNEPAADCDIVCINKYYGWYELPGDIVGGTASLGQALDRFRTAFGKPVMLAEFGADAVPGMHALPPVMFSEEFQAEIIEASILEARSRPWVVGTHVWCFADFKTPQSITRMLRNHKGVFTRDRTPKMAAHTLRRLWHPSPPRAVQ